MCIVGICCRMMLFCLICLAFVAMAKNNQSAFTLYWRARSIPMYSTHTQIQMMNFRRLPIAPRFCNNFFSCCAIKFIGYTCTYVCVCVCINFYPSIFIYYSSVDLCGRICIDKIKFRLYILTVAEFSVHTFVCSI